MPLEKAQLCKLVNLPIYHYMEKENEEVKEVEEVEEVETPETDATDWKAEAIKLREKARAQRETTKELKSKIAEFEKAKPQEKSSEPDYAKLAYLKSENVTHPDDQKIVQDEAARLKLSLTDVLQMDHIKTKLQSNLEARTAQEGMPAGKGRSGGAANDVEYHLAKGTTPDDQELAEKVINARMARESKKNSFSDTLFDG